MRYVCPAALVAFSILAPSTIFGQGNSLSITNYQFQGVQVISQTTSRVTYTATLVNSGPALSTVTATVSTLDPFSVKVVPGYNVLHFSHVAANSQTTTTDTFTLLALNNIPFDASKLQWTFQSTSPQIIANAGPNQTVGVGTNVTLNGSASTNPSGIGNMSYSWKLTGRPAGTHANLFNYNTVMPNFTVDVPGTYVATLTVSNGVATDSASVTISTVSTPPVANAGMSQTVPGGATVTLDGSASSTTSGNQLTYHWTFVSVPFGSTSILTGANTVAPKFLADKVGNYVVQLIVNDTLADSSPSLVTITTLNSGPVANAGTAQTVLVNSFVQLNGSASIDVDGDMLTYQWSLITVPGTSNASLNNPTSVTPSFTADVAGTYIAQLIVSDGTNVSAPSTVMITTNQVLPPIAFAGNNKTVAHKSTVILNGIATDPQGLTLSYQWTLTTVPNGSNATLSSSSPTATFVADLPGIYVAQLVVNNGFVNSNPSMVTITTTNTAPVADAGSPKNTTVNANVVLDGSHSFDVDHDPLTYSWTFTSFPSGSAATLIGANTASPNFTADVAGQYVIQLIVNDGFTNSNASTVMVTAAGNALGLSPNPLNLTTSPGTLTVTIPAPAGVNGQVVNLASSGQNIASVPPNVTIPANSTGANVTVTPGSVSGTAVILASASGFSNAIATVNVVVPVVSFSFAPPTATVTGAGITNLTLNLTGPAPANALTVNLSSSNTAVATVPPTVTLPAHATSVTVTVTGVAPGTATIHANAQNIPDATAIVTDVSAGGGGGTGGGDPNAVIMPANVTLQVNQTVIYPVSLPTPVQGNGVILTLTSSDPTKVTISPDSVFVKTGAVASVSTIRITGVGFGIVTINASAQGYNSNSQQVEVIAGMLSFSPPTLTITGTIKSSLNLTLSSPAPAGGLTVNLSSDNTAIATVPATATFQANSSSTSVQVTAVGAGSAVIHASDLPAYLDTTATVTVVTQPQIILPSFQTVGQFQSTAFPIGLSAPAPAGGVTVTLISSDTTKVTISPTSVFIAGGQSAPATQPQITGIDMGFSTITASAPGYMTASLQVHGTDQIFIGTPPNVTVLLGQSVAYPVSLPSPAPVGGITVDLSSSDPTSVGVTPHVFIAAGQTTAATPPQVTGLAIGTAIVTAAASGYSSGNQHVFVTGTINFNQMFVVIPGLITRNVVLNLSGPAPAAGLTINLSSENPSIVSVPATVTFSPGAMTVNVPMTGVAKGTTNVHAFAPNITDTVINVTVN